MKENDMVWAHGRDEGCIEILVGRSEEKEPLDR
jgi:hypothetical protein